MDSGLFIPADSFRQTAGTEIFFGGTPAQVTIFVYYLVNTIIAVYLIQNNKLTPLLAFTHRKHQSD
jgi:hypothetical protein